MMLGEVTHGEILWWWGHGNEFETLKNCNTEVDGEGVECKSKWEQTFKMIEGKLRELFYRH